MAERACPVDIQRETDHTNLGVAYTDTISYSLKDICTNREYTDIARAHIHI